MIKKSSISNRLIIYYFVNLRFMFMTFFIGIRTHRSWKSSIIWIMFYYYRVISQGVCSSKRSSTRNNTLNCFNKWCSRCCDYLTKRSKKRYFVIVSINIRRTLFKICDTYIKIEIRIFHLLLRTFYDHLNNCGTHRYLYNEY
jgi:hypothetical protein